MIQLVCCCRFQAQQCLGQRFGLKTRSTTRKPPFLTKFWSPASSASSGIRTHEPPCWESNALATRLYTISTIIQYFIVYFLLFQYALRTIISHGRENITAIKCSFTTQVDFASLFKINVLLSPHSPCLSTYYVVVFAGLRLNNAWASGTVLRPFLQPESPLSSRSSVSGFQCKLRDSNSRPPYSRPRDPTTRLYTIH